MKGIPSSFLGFLLFVLDGLPDQLGILLLQPRQFVSLVLVLALILVPLARKQVLLELQVGGLDDQSLLQQSQLLALELSLQLLLLAHTNLNTKQ
jgi:hypothetical protein